MVGNWCERKESGVDTKDGAIKVSVLKAVLFLWRGLKPPDLAAYKGFVTNNSVKSHRSSDVGTMSKTCYKGYGNIKQLSLPFRFYFEICIKYSQ